MSKYVGHYVGTRAAKPAHRASYATPPRALTLTLTLTLTLILTLTLTCELHASLCHHSWPSTVSNSCTCKGGVAGGEAVRGALTAPRTRE